MISSCSLKEAFPTETGEDWILCCVLLQVIQDDKNQNGSRIFLCELIFMFGTETLYCRM